MRSYDSRYRVRKRPKTALERAWAFIGAKRIWLIAAAAVLAAALILLLIQRPPINPDRSPIELPSRAAPYQPPAPGALPGPGSRPPDSGILPPDPGNRPPGPDTPPDPENRPPDPDTFPAPGAPSPEPSPEPQLREGMDSEAVRELQQRLMELGYIDIDEPTAHFGPATDFALQLFQRQHGLQIDGILGGETKRILFSEAGRPYTLFEGARGHDVEAFQERLHELGFLDHVTGYYGTDTVKAVTGFQKLNKLHEDGKAGEHTLDAIFSSKAKGISGVTATRGSSKDVRAVIKMAEDLLGKRYVWGAKGPKTFDCSGFVYYLLTHNGVKTGRLNALGFSKEDHWDKISKMSGLRAGDIVFFSTNGKRVGHTGLYIGDGKMIDASSSNGKVVKRSCTTAFWKRNFVCGRRPW